MNPAPVEPGNMRSPYFPPREIETVPTEKRPEKKADGESSSSDDESSEEEEPQIQSLLMPLRRFQFVEKHQFKSYAPDAVVTGSAVKEVEQVKEKVISKIETKLGIRKSRLQRFLDVFHLEKLLPFLTTRDVMNLSFSSFYFHKRVYDMTEADYTVNITSLCNVISQDCCGFLENNFVLLENSNFPGGNLINQAQMMCLRALLIAPNDSQAYMLKALHLEPERSVEETALFDFVRVLGGSSFCDYVVHLSLDGARLQAEGIGILCDAIQASKPEFESMGPAVLSNLEILNVRRNLLGYKGIHRLVLMLEKKFLPKMTTLLTGENSIGLGFYELLNLKFSLKRSKIVNYDFSGNDLSPADSEEVFLLRSNKFNTDHIQSLDLSFNTLDDIGLLKLWEAIWPLDVPISHHLHGQQLVLRTLNLQNTNIGDNSVRYLTETIRRGKLTHLVELNLSTNRISGVGFDDIMNMLMDGKGTSIQDLRLSLNDLGNEAIVAFAQCYYMGHVDFLRVLDVSDVGANADSMFLLGRQIVSRFNNGTLGLRKLVINGRQPFAGREVRKQFNPDFLMYVKVT